jgi:formylmethanofuran dehydrogenase subunit C
MKISEIYNEILESNSVDKPDYTIKTTSEDELEGLIPHFKKFHQKHGLDEYDPDKETNLQEAFEDAAKVTNNLEYTDRDINQLCKWLERSPIDTDSAINTSKPNAFVSAALENLEQEEVIITTPIGGIGYQNSKKLVIKDDYEGLGTIGDQNTGEIIVEGDATTTIRTAEEGKVVIEGRAYCPGTEIEGGEIQVKDGAYGDVGQGMKGGKITIEEKTNKANPAMEVGENMKGGEIKIHGVPSSAGYSMQGGEIYITEDAENVGFNMNAGKIHVEGDVEKIGDNYFDHGNGLTGGEIYVEGSIGEIIDEVDGTEIYQKDNGEWKEVHA